MERLQISERRVRLSDLGRQEVSFELTGGEVIGVVASATPYEREKLKSLKHEVTHVVIQRLGSAKAKVGDRLIKGEKIFYVEAVENPAGLGQWFIYYCNERCDL